MDFKFPDLEKSWQLLGELLSYCSKDLDTAMGLAALRKHYEATKIPSFGGLGLENSIFPADGRLDIKLEDIVVDVTWEKHLAVIEKSIQEYVQKQVVKEKFAQFAENSQFLVEWLMSLVTRYQPALVARNASDANGKGPKISTVIGNQIEQASVSWNGGLSIQGDYNYAMRRFPAEQRALVNDLAQLCFSYLCERVKVYTKSSLRLCLSINPLDLAMISMQTTNWRTCHSMLDGQYRAGNVGYMMDGVTAVAYVYENATPLEFMKKNSAELYPKKLWRTLVFMDQKQQTVIVGRHFPTYESKYAVELRKLLFPLLAKIWQLPKDAQICNHRRRETTRVPLEIVGRGEPNAPEGYGWGYIDATEEEYFPQAKRPGRITVTARNLICVSCGSPRRDGRRPGDIVCQPCREARRRPPALPCTHCGNAHQDNILLEGEVLCHHCFQQHEGGRVA